MNKYLEKIAAITREEADLLHTGYYNPGAQAVIGGAGLGTLSTVGGAAWAGKHGWDHVKKESEGVASLADQADDIIHGRASNITRKLPVAGMIKRVAIPAAIGTMAGTALGATMALRHNKKFDEYAEHGSHEQRRRAVDSLIRNRKNVAGQTVAGAVGGGLLPLTGVVSGTGAYLTNRRADRLMEKISD